MWGLVNRNLLLFIRDKSVVLLSFLAEGIVLVLYLFFMRDNFLKQFEGIKNVDLLLDVWIVAGILGITSMTTTMGAFGIMIEDRVKNIRRDFLVSPIRSGSLMGSYLITASIIGSGMSLLVMLMAQGLMFRLYEIPLLGKNLPAIFASIILITVSNSCLLLFGMSFLKSNNALASCCTLVGALIGFLTGIYLPMGSLPAKVELMLHFFSPAHGVALLRQLLMEPFIEQSFENPEVAGAFSKYMGIRFYIGEHQMSRQGHGIILLVAAGLFLLLSLWRMRRHRI